MDSPAIKRGKVQEYLRRNLLHASASGARANTRVALERVRSWQHPPLWLVAALEGIGERVEPLPAELADHRDELRAARPAQEKP